MIVMLDQRVEVSHHLRLHRVGQRKLLLVLWISIIELIKLCLNRVFPSHTRLNLQWLMEQSEKTVVYYFGSIAPEFSLGKWLLADCCKW